MMSASATTVVLESMSAHTHTMRSEATQETVNINRASVEELAAKLRGVGLARARAIIELRESLGGFTDVDQLLQVRGLGIKVLNENRERIIL
ncbi:helix-hairpin-helix domain-containing protein [Aliidiomarina halalkaliphila]|uniref:Helix-hairpin-helix domain-containing protein n=2 Tax=Aliidiomarina halalkaliphila TaxID=2593535 RepID=A0A552X674_9GAMM|nr:helix-hairpin-helix domain-containing protein [Aliidiomarina halalkaliphila]